MTLYIERGPRKVHKKRNFGKCILPIFFAVALLAIFPLRHIFQEVYYFEMRSSEEIQVADIAIASSYFSSNNHLASDKLQGEDVQKCGLPKPCPGGTFAFSIRSGAANVIPPKICFNNEMVISSSLKNTDGGMNIAVINARTGQMIRTAAFNMWLGDAKDLAEFLKAIENNTLVLMATFDDGATKITDETRKLIAELGSSFINNLAFRDNWIFAGGKGITGKSPFEKHIKNNKSANKYEDWPELVEMKGCFPQKLD